MKKPFMRYVLAVLACAVLYVLCITLMTYIGIGGVLPLMIVLFCTKSLWKAIVNYGEEEHVDSDTSNESLNTEDSTNTNEQ